MLTCCYLPSAPETCFGRYDTVCGFVSAAHAPIPCSCILTAKFSTATIYSTALTTFIIVTTGVSEFLPLESLRVQAKSSHDIPQGSLLHPRRTSAWQRARVSGECYPSSILSTAHEKSIDIYTSLYFKITFMRTRLRMEAACCLKLVLIRAGESHRGKVESNGCCMHVLRQFMRRRSIMQSPTAQMR